MSTNYLEAEVEYNDGHKCIPNGTGDYEFICPTHGPKPGFVPFLYRTLIRGRCVCGIEVKSIKVLGEVQDDES